MYTHRHIRSVLEAENTMYPQTRRSKSVWAHTEQHQQTKPDTTCQGEPLRFSLFYYKTLFDFGLVVRYKITQETRLSARKNMFSLMTPGANHHHKLRRDKIKNIHDI
ncbi:hypothetical protein AMECASPLE_028050 [Ameca splendens]|uniref:Uncharacterized protein n=1 Tax=Ameca splendens TaxID=208324 RepID=A0ABV0XIB8_9TELE